MDNQIRHYSDKLEFEIDSWDLQDALNGGEKIIVIDARSPQSYQNEHIPGAVNIPHRTMTAESTRQFDRTNLCVVYCDGIGCNASTKGALNMAKLGFRVKELIGGLDWWKRDGHKTEGSAVKG
ncbi:MAG TPA: rhodanese-like domain-containing protein [Verrucomicrobiae bacterium]|jgi:rhodanese-related sulfurtransferase